jgi:DNA-binding transcriptional LysR family regulator
VRFHQEVERALVSLQQTRASAAAIASATTPPIEIAAIPAIAAGLVPAALARLGDALPREVHLHSTSAEQVAQAVLTRRAEIGLASLPIDHPGLETHFIADAPCVVALKTGDRLADTPFVRLSSLSGRRLMTMANPYRLRRRVQIALERAGQAPSAIIATNATVNALMAVRAGLGVAVVEPVTAHGVKVEGVVIRPADIRVPFLWGVVTPLGQVPSPTIAALIAALRETAACMLPGFRLLDPADRDAIAAALYGAEPEAPVGWKEPA